MVTFRQKSKFYLHSDGVYPERSEGQKFRRMTKGIWWMPWDIEAMKDVA